MKSQIFIAAIAIFCMFSLQSSAQMFELVLDNTDPEVDTVGTWTEYDESEVTGSNGNNSVYVKMPGDGTGFTRYSMPAGGSLLPGSYTVYARWIAHPILATNTRYRIYSSTSEYVDVRVNQQENHARWIPLATVTISAPSPVIMVFDDANGYVEADGIRLVRVGEVPTSTRATTDTDAE